MEAKQREPLRNLPIRRYFKVDRNAWKQEPGRVFELATLPNEDAGTIYAEAVADITQPTRNEAMRAILGDGAEVGCNAVLNPGSVLGRRALVTPLTPFSGYLPAATIARSRNPVTTLPRRA